MKAILIIDLPNDLLVKETIATHITLTNDFIVKEMKIDCPLKPMPQKKNTDMRLSAIDEWLEYSERIGYNKCIDDIIKR